jgi:hypothetical protein
MGLVFDVLKINNGNNMNLFRIILVIALPFICVKNNLVAQEEVQKELSKFSLGISYDPSISYRNIKSEPEFIWLKNIYDSLEKPRYSFSSGINLQFDITKRFSLSSALLYTIKGHKIESNRELNTAEIISNYNFLSIPIKLNYNLIVGKNILYLMSGVCNDLLISSNQVHFNNEKTVETKFSSETALTNYLIAFTAGLGVDLKITDKSYFKMETFYQQSINSITQTPIKRYLFSYGAKVGVFVRF